MEINTVTTFKIINIEQRRIFILLGSTAGGKSSDSSLLFDSFSSSSSSSTTDSESVCKKARVENYLEVVAKYPDRQFKEHRLIEHYKSFIEKDNHGARAVVGPECKIFLTIWFLANTETYRQISDRFNVTKSSVYRILHRVVKWIVGQSHNYIKWPTSVQIRNYQIKFARMRNFSRIIGAIDGSHIKTNPPKNDRQAYYNRRAYYSILLQVIVGPNKTFIHVHCSELGSMHDARLFRKSGFYRKVEENSEILIPGGVLLRDSAYAESNYVVPPFKDFGNLAIKQRKFNYLHSVTRIVVENAFGLLKCRFRQLKFFESPDMGFITNCVVAACVLHNICIKENGTEMELYIEEAVDEEPDVDLSQQTQQNHRIREEIFTQLDNEGLLV